MPASAWAAKKLAIMASEGGASDKPVRAQITKVLKKNKVKVVGKPKAATPSDDGGWVALGRKLKVDGFVILGFDSSGSKHSVEVSIRNAGDGSAAGSETFSAKGPPKKLAAAVGKGLWNKLKSAIEGVGAAKGEATGMPARDLAREEQTAPAAAESKPVASEPDKTSLTETDTPAAPKVEETPTPSETKPEGAQTGGEGTPVPPRKAAPQKNAEADRTPTGKLPALVVTVAPHFMTRSFFYTPTSAAPTSGMVMPTIAGDATWFPITNLGVNVGGEFASWQKYQTKYPTITTELRAALIFRLQMSFGQLFAHAGGFRHFTAAQDDGTRTRVDQALPDVVYTGARMGAGGRFWLTDALSASVAASYRLTTSLAGGTYGVTTSQYFPNAVPGPGVDGSLTIALRLTSLLELQAGGDIRRYVIATRPSSSARINASYATDQYLTGWVGLSGVFGGR
jgi:hypothetical protein